MYWKIFGYVAAGLIIIALSVGLGGKLLQKTEGYKADEQTFQTSEPHFMFGGCAYYNAFKKPADTTVTVPAKK